MIKIEKAIPVPSGGMGRPPKYPFGQMKVGDSFLHLGSRYIVGCAASNYSTRHGSKMKFTVRKDGEGFRVWRIK